MVTTVLITAGGAASAVSKTTYRCTKGATVVVLKVSCKAAGLKSVAVKPAAAPTPVVVATTAVIPSSSGVTTTAVATESVSAANARKSADSYLRSSAFSRLGLIDQLVYSGFSNADATYAVDVVSVDWKQQAAKSAASYLKSSSFSRKSLVDQLIYAKFTPEQAEFGVQSTGL